MPQPELPVLEREEKPDIVELPTYTEEEIKYLGLLHRRLSEAQISRDAQHDEFDGMTYLQFYESNEKGANTYIPPKKSREETNFVTGTTRQKIFALLSSVNNLQLTSEFHAYDKDSVEISALGEGMGNAMLKSEELDGDEEKKLARQYELFKQGTVFVEDLWVDRFRLQKKFRGSFGKVSGVTWTTRLKKVWSGPERSILYGPHVYLGDIQTYPIKGQPYLFTARMVPYDVAEGVYGAWERWAHVPRKVTRFTSEQSGKLYEPWSFSDVPADFTEILLYQDLPHNELQILINGVMMLPIGFPLSFVAPGGGYTIEQQILEAYSNHFAYGRSMPQAMRVQQAVYDEAMRLAILKTQQSLLPPIANMTGRIISSKVFMPGKVTDGISPEQLRPLRDTQGLTNSEAQMLQILQDSIDKNSINPVAQGQHPKGRVTATQILEVQRSAQIVLGLIVFACVMLEKKVSDLRLGLMLEHWFDPVDKRLDEAKNVILDVYRSVTTEKPIEGRGMGLVMTEISDNPPAPGDLFMEEQRLSREIGKPVRKIVIDRSINLWRYIWQIVITPQEKKTSNLNRVLFADFMAQAERFAQDLNIPHMEERFALTWGEDPRKVFRRNEKANMLPMGANIGSPAAGVAEGLRTGPTRRTPQPSFESLTQT